VSRLPPASLLSLADQAPATVESALMQLVHSGSQVQVAADLRNLREQHRGALTARAA
jgi:hypothetical protein